MIWKSTFLHTVIDLLILGAVGYALAIFLGTGKRIATRKTRSGFAAIILGLALIAMLYLADLLTIFALPLFAGRSEAMAVMRDLHLNYAWLVVPLGVGSIALGLVAAHEGVIALIRELERSETDLKRELAAHRVSEQELLQTTARLEGAQRQAKLGYWRWSFEEGKLTYWSDEAAEIAGYDVDQLDLPYEEKCRRVHADDRQRVLDAYRAANAARREFEIEYRTLSAEGQLRYVREIVKVEYDARGTPVAHVGTVQDITEVRQIEAALRESEAWFRAVVNNSPTKIHIKDAEGRYVLVNPKAEKLFGVTDEEARGGTTDDLFPNEQATAFKAHDRAVLETGQTIEQEEEWLREDGVHTFLTVKFPILDAAGAIVGVGAIGTDITDRKRVEQALRASETRLAGILDIAPEAVISVDQSQRIQLFNKGAEAIFGYSADEVIGQALDTLLPSRFRESHHQRIKDFMHAPQATRLMSRREEVVGLRKDGTEFPAKASISKLRLGGETLFTVMLHDITKEKLARQKIENLAKIPDENPYPVLRVTGEGGVLYANDIARALEGLFDDPHHKALCKPLAQAAREAAISNMRQEVEFNAGKRTFAFALAPVSDESYVNFYGRDVTERKWAEATTLAAKEAAEIANRAKSEFLANMSHELRTPLNAVIGFAEIIRDEMLGPVGNPKYLDYAKDINDSGQHLLAIINDILDLSKIEAGTVELHEEEVDVSEVIRSCITLMAERARRSDVELDADLPGPPQPALYVDKRILKQILVNLLSNAVKFTPHGGRVTVTARHGADGGHVLQVVDTGIGIAPADIPKALARFGQVDSQLGRKYDGTGLGLPLTRSLVELHGGAFELESELGGGTTVTLRFPPERSVRRSIEAYSSRVKDREAS